ncbi:hypothetical protein V4F39_14765 [Aquincola sp. MAHUQ-54]|uniref:Uncharacterized protein n=1 Tax=Aquincola agrisoli TaxID=3119538 RepID=A0AAW9Q846_9BURK
MSSTPNSPIAQTTEHRIAADSPLVQLLEKEFGITDPKLFFVYGSAKAGGVSEDVLYVADSDLRIADLKGPVVLANTRVRPDEGEVIKVEYAAARAQYCTILNGVPVWIP